MLAETEVSEIETFDDGELIVPDPRLGDERITWKAGDKKSLEKAKERFGELLRSGWAAFRVTKDLKTGEQIHDFDPMAKKILMVQQMKGG